MATTASRALQATFNCLIVEDLKLHAKILERMVKMTFEKWDIISSSDWATSEQEALKFCAQKTYDLIIMDYHMIPKVGSEITRSILAKYPNAHIVGYSACNDPDVKEECIKSGMEDVLPKESQKMKQFLIDFAKRFWLDKFGELSAG